MSDTKIYFQPEDLANLKRQYKKALKAKKETFNCYLVQGITHPFYTPYAKYLIEYIESIINNTPCHQKQSQQSKTH